MNVPGDEILILPNPLSSLYDVQFVPRAVLGREGPFGDAVRASLGAADQVVLNDIGDRLPPSLGQFLAGQPAFRFVFLSLTCNFRPSNKQPLSEAQLAVRVRAVSDASAGEPIHWSVTPHRLATSVKRANAVNINAKARFVVGADVQHTRTSETITNDYYVIATGQGEPIAEWFFRRTKDAELVGMQCVSMIIRIPVGVSAVADMMLSATIERARGALRFRAELPDAIKTIELL